MDRLIIEGVRCFHEKQSVPIRPITILLGENSSGKTTFLAAVRLIYDVAQFELPADRQIDFNKEPFDLGAYAQVATYRGGKAGRVKDFTLGCECSIDPEGIGGKFEGRITLLSRFVERGAQPRLSEIRIDADPYKLTFNFSHAKDTSPLVLTTPSGTYESSQGFSFTIPIIYFVRRLMADPSHLRRIKIKGKSERPSERELDEIYSILRRTAKKLDKKPYAFAPIRTSPRRIYEPYKDITSPEGSHVPIILARILKIDPKGGERLVQSLARFGKASGLFEKLEIRRFGSKESDPFQIKIKISGPAFNLVDVGYGISQVLPIIVESVRESPGSIFLLQQPEVHLHPRAQAELGSFLAILALEQRKTFIIETHSDYILDRIRMDIRDRKTISPDAVSILYFERDNGGVSIQSLRIDASGNILKPPRGYRRFFLEEERRLLEG